MGIEIGGKKRKLGLALSGGGFRAAAFHLGCFTALKEVGLLYKLDLLTCVSGGSIAGGFLVANWSSNSVLEDFRTYLSTQSIAVSSVVGGLFSPFETRLEKLAQAYDRDLFHEKTLGSLAGGPRIYFNATNLATGNMFFFVAGKSVAEGVSSEAEMGGVSGISCTGVHNGYEGDHPWHDGKSLLFRIAFWTNYWPVLMRRQLSRATGFSIS